eukprot:CAMPEP_0185768568 /NCGR_PEP_ID=MMETSP1174-20130828/50601_1 /TAXON_ID=35687 /ORGANISM="Dictyocha speculum, Strain CCMP1381" /LENGTH=93 /DNA_ID=CAMNT_0028453309 /DNA_START=204 /DNA_END=482 /DNA_ORIENTATION=+
MKLIRDTRTAAPAMTELTRPVSRDALAAAKDAFPAERLRRVWARPPSHAARVVRPAARALSTAYRGRRASTLSRASSHTQGSSASSNSHPCTA